MRTKEEIINFFREHGCLNKFYRGYVFRHDDWIWSRSSIDALCIEKGDDFLNDAFRWSDTLEGHSYWDEINDEFRFWY